MQAQTTQSPQKRFPSVHARAPQNSSSKYLDLHGEAKTAYEVHSIIFISKKAAVHITNLSSVHAAMSTPARQAGTGGEQLQDVSTLSALKMTSSADFSGCGQASRGNSSKPAWGLCLWTDFLFLL